MAYLQEYQKWLNSPQIEESEREELLSLDEKEIESRFFAPLEFGTAGLRGVMAPGLHRMNVYVVRQVTEALARLILEEDGGAEKGVVIAHDCRHNADAFAREAACVFAANGVRVYLFDALRPTPELSFAIRHYGCISGINLTASHNTKEYGGYKVYWEDGAQLPPKHAAAVARLVETVDIFTGAKQMEFARAKAENFIRMIGAETDALFLDAVLGESIDNGPVVRQADEFSVVYTPFHGTGYQLVPETLSRLGVKNIYPVEAQMVLDGDFPTVKSPNPEERESFRLAVDLAREKKADLIIGTDPDADRVGIVVKTRADDYATISGNQTGVLLLNYLIEARNRTGNMPKNPYAVKTIVTTEMAREVARASGIPMHDTFTGFKFIAEKINEQEALGNRCIFSYEESYGYLIGLYARDKDAVSASMLLAEMTAHYREQKKTLFDVLEELYDRHGAFAEETVNLVMPGTEGLYNMRALMESLRREHRSRVGGFRVLRTRDYQSGTIVDHETGERSETPIKGSNVLYYELKHGIRFIVRPSGTEPKIKFYLLSRGRSLEEARENVGRMKAFVETLK
ncbi:phospho-sugar mutase [Oscillospiraceae bacterium OttesenSCG-928-G22]|nr:phospho-sugar mutase [Oscillospiraceae bacterium OttesenSCG-928-G22]